MLHMLVIPLLDIAASEYGDLLDQELTEKY